MPLTLRSRNFRNTIGMLLLLAFCFVFYTVFYEEYVPRLDPSYDIYIAGDKTEKGPRTMLLWNSLFRNPRWSLPDDTLGPAFFKVMGCEVTNCLVTNDRHFLSSIIDFDAILFHFGTEPSDEYTHPSARSITQSYVFSALEPPTVETYRALQEENEFFNLTMTFRLDSDIPWPYVSIVDIESGAIVAPAIRPNWRKVPEVYADEKLEKLVKGKKKFAVWIASHCVTSSRRELLVQELQDNIDVDVYGKCGTLSCKRDDKECDDLLERDYKFYFAFENSLCIDYVSEKLRHALSLNLVPVVFGGANYSRFAPPHSYIDANDFKDSQELANYLMFVGDNLQEYMRFFWWRKYYRAALHPSLCKLCAHLNTPLKKTRMQVYHDLRRWWKVNVCYSGAQIDF